MGDRIEILAHTADIKIRVISDSLRGLFQLSLQSLNQLLSGDSKSPKDKGEIKKDIELESRDTTSLLIDFLSEVLTLSQIHKAIFFDFKINNITEHEVSGTLSGSRVKVFSEDVKAVTYHEANVKVNEQGDWETLIVFDI